jgi:hypothetical protein
MHDGAAASGRSLTNHYFLSLSASISTWWSTLSLSSLRVLIDTQISRRALVLASGFVLSCKNASSSSKGAFIFAVYAPHGCKDVIINKLSANKLARATQHHHQRGHHRHHQLVVYGEKLLGRISAAQKQSVCVNIYIK